MKVISIDGHPHQDELAAYVSDVDGTIAMNFMLWGMIGILIGSPYLSDRHTDCLCARTGQLGGQRQDVVPAKR